MPIYPDSTPPSSTLPRNRLVKRTASLHSANGSPSGSKLPVPTFRRPVTSYQRSATLQERLGSSDPNGGSAQHAHGGQWRHYFTPRVSGGEIVMSIRRRSTGIPNPIKRVYPDRRYTPMLVSARDMTVPARVEIDNELSDQEESSRTAGPVAIPSTASSPFPPQAMHFEGSDAPRRSFSIPNMFQPQSARQRPSSSRGKPRTLRKARPRVFSEPQAPMGNIFSTVSGHESERPAKRRDLTDPQHSQRSIYSSSSNGPRGAAERPQEIDLDLNTEPSPLYFTPDHSLFVQPLSPAPTSPLHDQERLSSASHSSSSARPPRLSTAQSEITSTIGSDSECRSLGDKSTDYQSDNAYDSIQTRTTRSSSGRRGPHIETIFDDSPPAFSSGRSTKLRDFLGDGQFAGGERLRHSTIEEEESVVSTPVRSVRNKSVTSTPSARPGASQMFSSSPPMMRTMPDSDEIDWDASEDEKTDSGLGIREPLNVRPTATTLTDTSLPFRFGPSLRKSNSRSANSTPQRNGALPMEKTNLFDWSEQQPSPSHPNRSPPRPRTVHGKKDQDSRGSRPAGRRPTSGMHARSHSVPVVPDLDGKRQNVVANKFGTWGVGSKAVTEDWNEDFDFDESPLPVHVRDEVDGRRIDSGHDMFVPKSIREQQENVVANIGLLREWGLLIEELKELRIRAVALGMMNGQQAKIWREVDAMIELADQETEEHTLEPRRSPPSSPGFDYSAFEDTPVLNKTKNRRSQSSSVKTPEMEKFPNLAASPQHSWAETPQATPITSRPRKDSELVAQSVIAALQCKRKSSDPTSPEATSGRKVPFDTATLRHIVPYVNGLKRKVKDALRETEGLYSSPHRRTTPPSPWQREETSGEPRLRHMFKESSGDHLTSWFQSRRERAATDNDDNEVAGEKRGHMLHRVQRLSFPS
ncbi:Hypothetical predicted protein [Lecanosticta acicola]|uniref:Uncharacterized protein n=1 Tax=Lecanosticta acicola TaxID=111012 RepID=A0AAI9E9Y5_9PEZI|nr:Hypothetical predicted protein [Lecanosticta acicola]